MSRRTPLVVALVLLASSFPLAGCERKAPGPDECRAFAFHVYGVADGKDVRLARVRSDVDELTRECLVTPYDREYLLCVEQSRNVRRCQLMFKARRGE